PWIPLVPLTFFGLTILSGHIIVRNIEDAIAKVRLGERNKDEEGEEVKSFPLTNEELFKFKHTM
ncbi:peptide ABC transporter permease, partial [Bacillus pseudomycoides]|nr:peptide ABC transporter permease [Bacillus pseudomycoides]